MESIAKRFFCRREHDDVFSLTTPAQRQRALFACRTPKEAFVKARGKRDGLAWNSHDLALTIGYAEALAYRDPRRLVRLPEPVSAIALLRHVAV